MVMPNNNPPSDGRPPAPFPSPTDFFCEVSGATAPAQPYKCREANRWLQNFLASEDMLERDVKRATECGCATCQLHLRYATATRFVIREAVSAAFTGNTAKLDELLAKIEELKRQE